MTAIDDKIIPKVKLILDKVGKSVTFTIASSETYDRTTGVNTKTTTTKTVTISPPFAFSTNRIDGDLIRQGDLGAIVSSDEVDFTPALDQRVDIDGVEYDVVMVSPIYSGERIAAYELGMRR